MADRRSILRAATAGLASAVAVSAILFLLIPQTRETTIERGFDLLLTTARALQAAPAPTSPPVVVVDIDEEALDLAGPWPWRRRLMADLVEIAARSGAAAVALDIVFAAPDTRSPAALARRLAEESGRAEVAALARQLEDDDPRLAAALAQGPSVLGFALSPAAGPLPPAAPLLRRGRAGTPWRAPGAEGPLAAFAAVAAGVGTTALPGDADGLVRRVPLVVLVEGEERPGLALEAVRVALGADHLRLDFEQGRYRVGDREGALGGDGLLRLQPIDAAHRPRRISAAEVLTSAGTVEALRGTLVFIGGSAPELGGLRATAGRPLVASVEIQAAAAEQILAADTPRRIGGADHSPSLSSWALALAPALPAAAIGAALPPLAGAFAAAALALGIAAAAVAVATQGLLVDPLMPLATLLAGYGTAALVSFAGQSRQARRIRRRFEQHLAPQIVERIAREPTLLRLAGERRIVTALFTDVADFAALTRSSEPEALVAALDAYFEGVTRIIVAHGGLIDKFVGDAVHAFFNVPLDRPGHAEAAVRCAIALHRWTEAARHEAGPAALGFGFTRIGIETGEAIVGEIGLGSKLDYTAYGDAVNAASRLEAANKGLGTRICVGPGAAALCPPGLLVASGTVELRGIAAAVAVFEPAELATERGSLKSGTAPAGSEATAGDQD